jgi:hypothetical protein
MASSCPRLRTEQSLPECLGTSTDCALGSSHAALARLSTRPRVHHPGSRPCRSRDYWHRRGTRAYRCRTLHPSRDARDLRSVLGGVSRDRCGLTRLAECRTMSPEGLARRSSRGSRFTQVLLARCRFVTAEKAPLQPLEPRRASTLASCPVSESLALESFPPPLGERTTRRSCLGDGSLGRASRNVTRRRSGELLGYGPPCHWSRVCASRPLGTGDHRSRACMLLATLLDRTAITRRQQSTGNGVCPARDCLPRHTSHLYNGTSALGDHRQGVRTAVGKRSRMSPEEVRPNRPEQR